MLQPGFPALGKLTGPNRFFNLPGPATFTLLFLKHNRTIRLCVQPCWVCQVYLTNKSKPSEEMGEKTFQHTSTTIYPPPLPYYYRPAVLKTTERFWTAGFEKREYQTQRRRGERMSFYTYRGKTRGRIRAGFVKRVQTQRRRGERMSLLPLSRPIDRVWLRAGFEKREYQIQRRRGERICVEIFI